MVKKLLEGIKVIDFTWGFAGPRTCKTLGDFGAEVIKIESKKRSDPARIQGPFKDNIRGLDRSGYFAEWNCSKRSITLDLTHPKGIDLAKRFAAWADIVVESFARGAINRMGLGYDELKKVNPDIVMLSTSALGQTGPYGMHPGYGGPLSGLAGFSYISGWPDRQPADLFTYTDDIGPHFNLLALLIALDFRRRTGKGQYFDMSQFENSVHFLAPIVLDYAVNHRVANRMGNRCHNAAPHGAYRCFGEDRWCAIAVFTDAEWASFCQVIGNPDWTQHSKFSALAARKENEDELNQLVEEWTISRTAEEVMGMMQGAGVAAGIVETAQDLLENDPQLKYREFYRQLDHPEMGKYYAAIPPFVLSKSPPPEVRCVPLLGEDNEYAVKTILGMTDEEVAELVLEGVIE